MKVSVSQIYVDPEATFSWSIAWQQFVSKRLDELILPSPAFVERFGAVENLIFRISAKRGITSTEVRGPTHFKRAKDVEFTIFVPHPELGAQSNAGHAAMMAHLFDGVTRALHSVALNSEHLQIVAPSVTADVMTIPGMLEAG